MSVHHHDIYLEDVLVGHAISLLSRYVFYSACPELADISEQRFDSIAAISEEISRKLRAVNGHPQ